MTTPPKDWQIPPSPAARNRPPCPSLESACADARRLYLHFNSGAISTNPRLDASRISSYIQTMEWANEYIHQLQAETRENDHLFNRAFEYAARANTAEARVLELQALVKTLEDQKQVVENERDFYYRQCYSR